MNLVLLGVLIALALLVLSPNLPQMQFLARIGRLFPVFPNPPALFVSAWNASCSVSR